MDFRFQRFVRYCRNAPATLQRDPFASFLAVLRRDRSLAVLGNGPICLARHRPARAGLTVIVLAVRFRTISASFSETRLIF